MTFDDSPADTAGETVTHIYIRIPYFSRPNPTAGSLFPATFEQDGQYIKTRNQAKQGLASPIETKKKKKKKKKVEIYE
jgi:hypothetical protein